ncbi:hypothetical protein E2320_006081 [Naja naja]|nr:hypothetical protein E2320_006081 [Naja naja]
MADQVLTANSMAGQRDSSAAPRKTRSRKGRSASQDAADKMRAKAIYSRKPTRAEGKDADRRMKALEKQISKIQKKTQQESIPASVLTETVAPLPPASLPAYCCSSFELQRFEPQVRGRVFTPEVTFTPTASGLCPVERQEQGLSEELKFLISQAISQGVANTLRRGSHAASVISELPAQMSHHYMYPREAEQVHRATSPTHSLRSRPSVIKEPDQVKQDFSDDDLDLVPDPPPHLLGCFAQHCLSPSSIRPEPGPKLGLVCPQCQVLWCFWYLIRLYFLNLWLCRRTSPAPGFLLR